jgi:isochorismate hydrolase
MPKKEKYLTNENLATEVKGIRDEIQRSGGRHRNFLLNGNPALLVTDMQDYFLSPNSHAFIPSAEAIIPNIIHLIDLFLIKKYPVIFTQHINDEKNAGNMKTWWKDLISINSNYHKLSTLPPFHPSTVPLIIKKSQYDAFFGTDLEKKLTDINISTLIICGVMTNLCCETTLRSAFVRGFNAIIPLDATAAYKKSYHISTFVNLSFGFCPVKNTTEILELLDK